MKPFFIAALVATVSMSCNSAGSSTDQTVQDTTAIPPVETTDANTDYKPAFEGQTRIAGVTTSTPYESTVVTSSLSEPWGIEALPDGRLLITENEGYMVIVDPKSGEVGEPITGIPEVDNRGQGGL